MKLFIQFDAKGRILSAVKVHAASHGHHPFAHTHKPDLVMEVDVTPEIAELPAHEIAERYQVDMKNQQLHKKTAARAAKKVTKEPVKEVTRKPRKTNPGQRGR